MPNDDMPVQEEQYESIPWSHLVEQARPQPWLTYVAAAVVVAVVLGVVVARNSPPDLPSLDETWDSTTVPAAPTTVAAISEQDLRAGPILDDGARVAATRAEWFVRDYFTVDAAGGRTEEVTGALGWSPPIAGDEPTTYVEWARAWSVEPLGTRRYRVSVVFRSITQQETSFVRGLPRAVAVDVKVDELGGARVLDLPEPTELPPSPTAVPPPGTGDPPPPVTDRALDLASGWGDPLGVLEGADTGAGWRVVVTIADEFGTPWPLVVRVDDAEPSTSDG